MLLICTSLIALGLRAWHVVAGLLPLLLYISTPICWRAELP